MKLQIVDRSELFAVIENNDSSDKNEDNSDGDTCDDDRRRVS